MNYLITCNTQFLLHLGSIISFSGHQSFVDTCLWWNRTHTFSAHLGFSYIVIFLLSTTLSICINFDALLLLIIAACFVVSCCCLFFLRFLMYRYDFTARFIFFSLFIVVAQPFGCSAIGCLTRFRFVFLDLCLTSGIVFDCCGGCIPYGRLQHRRSFPFRILPFLVRFSGVVWACVEPRGQLIAVAIPMV